MHGLTDSLRRRGGSGEGQRQLPDKLKTCRHEGRGRRRAGIGGSSTSVGISPRQGLHHQHATWAKFPAKETSAGPAVRCSTVPSLTLRAFMRAERHAIPSLTLRACMRPRCVRRMASRDRLKLDERWNFAPQGSAPPKGPTAKVPAKETSAGPAAGNRRALGSAASTHGQVHTLSATNGGRGAIAVPPTRRGASRRARAAR